MRVDMVHDTTGRNFRRNDRRDRSPLMRVVVARRFKTKLYGITMRVNGIIGLFYPSIALDLGMELIATGYRPASERANECIATSSTVLV